MDGQVYEKEQFDLSKELVVEIAWLMINLSAMSFDWSLALC